MAHGREGIGTTSQARVSGHFGEGPGPQGVRTLWCEAAGQGIGTLCGSKVGGVSKNLAV